MSNLTWATVVPLIGGINLGASEAAARSSSPVSVSPEYVLSYLPFSANDSHYISYMQNRKGWKGKYICLDSPEFANYIAPYVDIVTTTCPCAGLSSLSTTSNPDSATNDWMYHTAEYVLEKIKPQVFWGENAPRLFSNFGKKVADNLHRIARKHGYSMTLYYTESTLHGLSQRRPRTFYFFVKGDNAAIFPWHKKEATLAEESLHIDENLNDPMNVSLNKDNPLGNPWVAYHMFHTNSSSLHDLYTAFPSTQKLISYSDGAYGKNLNYVAEWMDNNGYASTAAQARRMQSKLDAGKGYWAHGITLPKGIIPSMIGSIPWGLINTHTGKYVSVRDCLRLMKMPEDFNLVGPSPENIVNHVAQNVPVTTAADIMSGVISYCSAQDKAPYYTDPNSTYIKQNNKKHTYETGIDVKSNTVQLDSFFNLQISKNNIQ